jgi:hypothetical protein
MVDRKRTPDCKSPLPGGGKSRNDRNHAVLAVSGARRRGNSTGRAASAKTGIRHGRSQRAILVPWHASCLIKVTAACPIPPWAAAGSPRAREAQGLSFWSVQPRVLKGFRLVRAGPSHREPADLLQHVRRHDQSGDHTPFDLSVARAARRGARSRSAPKLP